MSKPFHLPFLPRLNSVMTQMPVMRVTVKTDHPENFTKETAFAAAQQELARQQPKILSYYQGQQANVRASGLELTKTHMVSESVELRHTDLNGTPILEIIVNVDALLGQLCMMVLHSGNKITAFDMKALDKGKLSKVYSATLQQSSWGNDALLTTQYRYAKDWTIVYGPLAFSKSTISSQSYFCLSRTNKLAASCLTQSVASRTPRYLNGEVSKTFDPLVTNSGNTFYTPYDNYTVDKTGIVFSGDGSSVDDSPYVIDKTGLAYYGLGAGSVYAVAGYDVPSSTQTRHEYGYLGNLKPAGAVRSVQDAAWEVEATVSAAFFDYVGYYRGLDVVINTAYAPYPTNSFAPHPYVDPDLSLDLPFLTCTQTAGLDVLDVDMRNVSMVMSGAWQLAVSQPTFTATLDGISAAVHESQYEALYLIAWPPGVSNKRYFVRGVGINPDVTFTVYTPYEQFTVYSDAFNARDAIRFFPRLHASNGKHILQGFTAEADTRFYLDGTEIGAKLAKLCGCATSDIQSVLLDIPLARIKQFK